VVNWKKLVRQIPDRVQVGRKSWYTILRVVKPPSGDYTAGECDPNTKTIFIRINETPRQTVLTYLHELTHAISFELELDLTETQVSKIETKALHYLLKEGNVFK
jgi:hypothetical protein